MLTDNDVYTLMGHAAYLRGLGQTDMPRYFFDLAVRIAEQRGDRALAEQVKAVGVREMNAGRVRA